MSEAGHFVELTDKMTLGLKLSLRILLSSKRKVVKDRLQAANASEVLNSLIHRFLIVLFNADENWILWQFRKSHFL